MKTECITTLKRHATRLLSDLRKSEVPILITAHGKPVAYLVGVESYEFMQQRLSILEGIVRGEWAALENRTCSQAAARAKMKEWLA